MLKKSIIILLISILPIVELRGAIPVGAGFGLPFYLTYPLAVVGNLLPVPFILLFIPKILDLLGRYRFFRPIVSWLRRKADKGSKKLLKDESTPADIVYEEGADGEWTVRKNDKRKRRDMSSATFIALLSFVAIPLPVTGAWTGALVAALFSLPKRKAFLAILSGVLISGVIVSLISYGILGFLYFLL